MPAAGRQDDVKRPAVGGTGVPHDETVALETVDRARDPALRQEGPCREVGRSDAILWTPGDLHEEEVLAQRQATAAVGKTLEGMRCGRVGAQERLPAGLFGLAEPALSLRWNRLRRQPVDCIIN